MRIGIIGAGAIGGTLARRLTELGHQVRVANSRGPASLAAVAKATGARAVTVEDGVRRALAMAERARAPETKVDRDDRHPHAASSWHPESTRQAHSYSARLSASRWGVASDPAIARVQPSTSPTSAKSFR